MCLRDDQRRNARVHRRDLLPLLLDTHRCARLPRLPRRRHTC
ncbi:hypothetical protein MYA_5609 [Burkholderia sp. KJ006]|nr:hypothetical protein MYA_5609 [Burkholderia sp. KJ006]